MSGAWVAWGSPARTPAHATDPIAERIADLHFLFGEGPAIDAVLDGGPVTAPDLTSTACQRRWPAFAPPAQAAGARALVTVPMRVGPTRIGLFGLYSRLPTVLDAERAAEVEAFAEIAFGLLLEQHRPTATDVDQWLSGDTELHQATGIVSVQLGLGVDESLVRLRAHALAQGRSLSEIAREIVTRQVRLSPDTPKRSERHP